MNAKAFYPSVTIFKDQYSNNTAVRNGGSIFLNWESLAATGVYFTHCSAKNGGAIYYANIGNQIFQFKLLNPQIDNYYNKDYGFTRGLIFTNNQASNSGGALKLLFRLSRLNIDITESSRYTNNNDSKGLTISAGRPSYYLFSFYNVTVEKNFNEFDNLQLWVEDKKSTVITYYKKEYIMFLRLLNSL